MMMVDFLPRSYDTRKEPISLGGPNVILIGTLPSNERGASAHARSIDRRATKDARGALTLRHKQKLERPLISRFINGLERF